MILSDISITRPVLATVMSLILIAFGIVSFDRLPLREYPNIDPPIVTVDVSYPGASAAIVETRVTELIEERIAGVPGIRYISSSSSDGRSRVSLEFDVERDIDNAANDVRERISGVLDNLPEEADPPEVQKVDSSDDVIIWFNLESDTLSVPELTDYADRYLVDQLSVVNGVASVRIGGQQSYAMRVWIDRNELAARGLTVGDVESTLRSENVELPAGSVESKDQQFTVRVERSFRQPEDFANLVIGRSAQNGYLVRLRDVARVEKGLVEDRTMFRGNGKPMVGIGIIKQSTANTIDVADGAIAKVADVNRNLPESMHLVQSYDTSVFIRASVHEVYMTLLITIVLVVAVIFTFIGSWRSTLIPAVTVPVSLVATFIVLYAFGFSINLLTLLALVLAIGLVVDDAIVVLENVDRRVKEYKETPLVAAFYGVRQVGFAVIATTLVLVAVFVPITFMEGDLGRLFREFGVTMAATVLFSSFVALTLSAMLCAKLIKAAPETEDGTDTRRRFTKVTDDLFTKGRDGYMRMLGGALKTWPLTLIGFIVLLGVSVWMYLHIPSEYAPKEDRGSFFVRVNGPEGASYAYMKEYMDEIERRLMPLVETGEATRLLVRAPQGFGAAASFNGGFVIVGLDDWGDRRPIETIIGDVRARLADLPGVVAFPTQRQAFGGGAGKPVQFVIGGGTYEQLAEWRDILVEKINENNPGLTGIDWDYKETKPQFRVDINYTQAAELGVSVTEIGRTLETLLGSRRVTTYIEDGKEYDVIIEGERSEQRTPTNMENIYVRSAATGELIPLSNLITISEYASSPSLNRYNRVRSITIDANLEEDYTLGEALSFMERLVRDNLPDTVQIDYKGQSKSFKDSGGSILFVFALGIAVVFLVLAAQFESFVHPLVIILTVPLAVAGGLFGLYITGASLNVYSQIGLVVLVGIATKNGILIVEFANQLRDQGMEFIEALNEACRARFRPILMTSITTVMGAVPLVLASGAGAETRIVIGTVIIAGVLAATFFTLFLVPVAYALLARHTGSAGDIRRRLENEEQQSRA